MQKTKTSVLSGNALNWAVPFALGWTGYENDPVDGKVFRRSPEGFRVDWRIEDNSFEYDWDLAGPVIYCEGITVGPHTTSPFVAHYGPSAITQPWENWMVGPHPLIAAMRCFVAHKLGAEIDVPDGLQLDDEITAPRNRNKP